MTEQVDTAVRRTITVPVTHQRAFEVFTAQFGSWWPKNYSIGETKMADFVLEPKVGGRWYEVGVDGTECETGRVTAFEPPDSNLNTERSNGTAWTPGQCTVAWTALRVGPTAWICSLRRTRPDGC